MSRRDVSGTVKDNFSMHDEVVAFHACQEVDVNGQKFESLRDRKLDADTLARAGYVS